MRHKPQPLRPTPTQTRTLCPACKGDLVLPNRTCPTALSVRCPHCQHRLTVTVGRLASSAALSFPPEPPRTRHDPQF